MAETVDLLTTAQVAAALGIQPSRVRQLARSDRLGRLFAGRLVFGPDDVTRLRERKTRPGPDKRQGDAGVYSPAEGG